MSKIRKNCIFYIEDKNTPLPPNTFCIVEGKFIQSCQDCSYFLDNVRTISMLALELKMKAKNNK